MFFIREQPGMAAHLPLLNAVKLPGEHFLASDKLQYLKQV
jgi:hypothetical protein